MDNEGASWLLLNVLIPFTIIPIVLVVIIVAFVSYAKKKKTFECKTCHNRIEVDLVEMMFSVKSFTDHKLYCPVCKKKCWHKRIF